MTTRHTVEPDDQRVPVAATAQRRGAMYMRAEARRAAELGVVATTAAPKKRGVPRRIQLAAFAAVWLLVAGVTAVVGIRWAREDRTPPVPTRAAAERNGVHLAGTDRYYLGAPMSDEFILGFAAIGEYSIRKAVRRLAD